MSHDTRPQTAPSPEVTPAGATLAELRSSGHVRALRQRIGGLKATCWPRLGVRRRDLSPRSAPTIAVPLAPPLPRECIRPTPKPEHPARTIGPALATALAVLVVLSALTWAVVHAFADEAACARACAGAPPRGLLRHRLLRGLRIGRGPAAREVPPMIRDFLRDIRKLAGLAPSEMRIPPAPPRAPFEQPSDLTREREHDERIERLKTKSRHLIDVAYNRAIDDVLRVLTNEGDTRNLPKVRRLKRIVRSAS